MSDAELHGVALKQLSGLNDYHQQLIIHKQHLSHLTHERMKYEQQVLNSETLLHDQLLRLAEKQKRLANLRILKEQAQIKLSINAALGKWFSLLFVKCI